MAKGHEKEKAEKQAEDYEAIALQPEGRGFILPYIDFCQSSCHDPDLCT